MTVGTLLATPHKGGKSMAHVVVLGAGLGGTIMAYELRDELDKAHTISVVSNGSHYSFVPSADTAAQRQLVILGKMGAHRQGRV
jgi:hypothetical protein